MWVKYVGEFIEGGEIVTATQSQQATVTWDSGVFHVTFTASVVEYRSEKGVVDHCRNCREAATEWLRVTGAEIRGGASNYVIDNSSDWGKSILEILQNRRQFWPYCRSCRQKLFNF